MKWILRIIGALVLVLVLVVIGVLMLPADRIGDCGGSVAQGNEAAGDDQRRCVDDILARSGRDGRPT